MRVGAYGTTGSGRRRNRGGRPARQVLALAALLAVVAPAAQAQEGRWWERIPGFGGQESGPTGASARRGQDAQAAQNDLRTGPVPMRSEGMLAFLDAAIARYSQIAQKGGWPTIPGTRMLRPGDRDERVPYVRRRLVATGEMRRGPGDEAFNDDGEHETEARHFE